MFSFVTREIFDTIILINILVGLILASIRLYQDLSRPLPSDDTQPSRK